MKVYVLTSGEYESSLVIGIYDSMEKAIQKAHSIKSDKYVSDHIYDEWAMIGDFLQIESYVVE